MSTVLPETEAKQLLAEHGIPVVNGVLAGTVEAALEAAHDLGYPVALKVSHPQLLHKTDIGGVVLGVEVDDVLTKEVARLLGLRPGAQALVEKMAPEGGLDLIAGLKRDPVFGPVVMLGMGGIFAEVLADTALHVGPLDRAEALELVEGLRGKALLQGARGSGPLDTGALADALVLLSQLASSHPDLAELDINPLRVYPRGVLALDAVAIIGDVKPAPGRVPCEAVADRVAPLFSPASVAVVGPSRTNERAGNIIIKNMKALGYKGTIYPVNRAGGFIEGLPAYTGVTECPKPVELAVLAVPYRHVHKVMTDVAAAGTKHAIVVSGGFSDAGESGKKREARLVDYCREHGINLMGPNSIGTLDARSGFTTSIGKLPVFQATGASVFGQSGALSTGFILKEATVHKGGLSKIACLGNKADIDECDFLEYLGVDPDTKCIGMYLEGIKDGDRFFAAAKAAAARKPVVVLKSGRTEVGAKAAASHTGSLAGSDAVYDAVFRQAGIQRVFSVPMMFDVLRAFDRCSLPRGNRIGVVSISGMGCVLTADACGDFGMQLARVTDETQRRLEAMVPEWAPITNPADIWTTIEQKGPAESFRMFSEVMLEDANIDILLVISVLLEEGSFEPAPVLEPLAKAHPDKPILACYLGGRKDLLEQFREGLEAVNIPVFDSPERAVHVASYLWQHRKGTS